MGMKIRVNKTNERKLDTTVEKDDKTNAEAGNMVRNQNWNNKNTVLGNKIHVKWRMKQEQCSTYISLKCESCAAKAIS